MVMGNFGHAILQNAYPVLDGFKWLNPDVNISDAKITAVIGNGCSLSGSMNYTNCQSMLDHLYPIILGSKQHFLKEYFPLLTSKKDSLVCFETMQVGLPDASDYLGTVSSAYRSRQRSERVYAEGRRRIFEAAHLPRNNDSCLLLPSPPDAPDAIRVVRYVKPGMKSGMVRNPSRVGNW